MEQQAPKVQPRGNPKEKNQKQVEEHNQKPKEQKIDSVLIARQIVSGPEQQIGKWLSQYRNIKSTNYDKFTDRITSHLSSLSLQTSISRFCHISNAAAEVNASYHQMSAILNGFLSDWVPLSIRQNLKQKNFEENDLRRLFLFVEKVFLPVVKRYTGFVRGLIWRVQGQKMFEELRRQAGQMVSQWLKSKTADQHRIFPLVYQYDLFQYVPQKKLVELVMRHNNVNDAAFLFTIPTHLQSMQEQQPVIRLDLLKAFIDRCIATDSKSDLSKCQSIIRTLKVDPFNYPHYITKMQQKYIAYLQRSYKLYFTQLIIAHDPKLVYLLVQALAAQGKHKEADYFVYKYQLEEQFKVKFTPQEKEKLKQIKNVLVQEDYFGPTEVEVLEQVNNEERTFKFWYAEDFGIKEANVIVVDKQNIDNITCEQFTGGVGIDQQRSGGTHVFDPPTPSTLQLYCPNSHKVYIFDILSLDKHQKLQEIIVHVFTHCTIYGQDMQKQLTCIQKQLELPIEEKVMQHLNQNRLVDSSKLFKKVFPKETKSNLNYISEFVFQRSLSKYEQCSGWVRRPLRKAQLHYAALDCILPLKICQKLAQIQKSRPQKQ